MILIGLLAGLGVTLISPKEFTWGSFGTAFSGVFLVGLLSLVLTGLIRKKISNDVVNVLTGTIFRTTLIGGFIIVVVVTQSKNFAFYMLCFSVVFYFGMVFLNAWLITPGGQKRRETVSDRD